MIPLITFIIKKINFSKMFSFSNNFVNDDKGIEGAKIVKMTSLFNNRNSVEFSFGPDKRCIKLSESQLSFAVELPSNYLPDMVGK